MTNLACQREINVSWMHWEWCHVTPVMSTVTYLMTVSSITLPTIAVSYRLTERYMSKINVPWLTQNVNNVSWMHSEHVVVSDSHLFFQEPVAPPVSCFFEVMQWWFQNQIWHRSAADKFSVAPVGRMDLGVASVGNEEFTHTCPRCDVITNFNSIVLVES